MSGPGGLIIYLHHSAAPGWWQYSPARHRTSPRTMRAPRAGLRCPHCLGVTTSRDGNMNPLSRINPEPRYLHRTKFRWKMGIWKCLPSLDWWKGEVEWLMATNKLKVTIGKLILISGAFKRKMVRGVGGHDLRLNLKLKNHAIHSPFIDWKYLL